jgi:hypothetical protein
MPWVLLPVLAVSGAAMNLRTTGVAAAAAAGGQPGAAGGGAGHWSFAAPTMPSIPTVGRPDWVRTDVDRFVLAKLEERGLSPAGEADRLTLIRRATFDLTGLPPTPEEVDAFLADPAPDAYEKLIDRLLASPHYGERWGRHWLDVVRYGESQGFERNRIRPNAWRYRDWVIGAFNDDLPYDEFVRRQIAGDVLYPNDLGAMIATGYHVIGTWDQVAHLEGSAPMQKVARLDTIEDLVATLGQAYMGLTINCARCHDHKFDPIKQKEYYQVAALLGGVTQEEKERQDVRVVSSPEREAALRAEIETARHETDEAEAEVQKLAGGGAGVGIEGLQALYRIEDQGAGTLADASSVGDALELRKDGKPRWSSGNPPRKWVSAAKASGEISIEAWITPGKPQQSGPARVVTLSADASNRNVTLGHDGTHFEVRLRTTKTNTNGIPAVVSPEGTVKAERMHVVYTFARDGMARLYVNGKRVAEQNVGGDLSNWDENLELGLGDEFTGDRAWDGAYHFVGLYARALTEPQIVRSFETQSREVRPGKPIEELLAAVPSELRDRHAKLLERRKQLESDLSKVSFSGPLHVIVPRQPPVFHELDRGNIDKPKDVVAPAGVAALAGLPADFGLAPDAPEAQRRVKLAEWLTDPRNPLTARVFVNRVWHYHFGQGIVDTPSEFGVQGGRPTHPELLDFLALRFRDGGWRVKDLHRLIMTSAAYRQQSLVRNEAAEAVDADNRMLWRFNRRRLDGESVRDAALAASGALNRQLGGPSFRDVKVEVTTLTDAFTDPTNEFSPDTCRRTVYRMWARAGGNPMLESFDCPEPSVLTPRRTNSITPVQALSLLNNGFIEQCAARFAQRARDEAGGAEVDRQIGRAYRLALSRPPSAEELAAARPFVQEQGLEQFCVVLFNTNEFLFVN